MVEKKTTTKKPTVKKSTVRKVVKKKSVPKLKKGSVLIATRHGRVAGEVKKKSIKVEKKPIKVEKKKISDKYIEAVGRRKTAVARIRFWTKSGEEFLVNEKNYKDYFPTVELQKIIFSPLEIINMEKKLKISARIKGGGLHAQAEAIRHGLSRALIKFDPELRKQLKKTGFLTRDPRMRERKKFGLKRARKGSQWSKR